MVEVIRANITTLAVDAIVNAANAALSGGGGVDGAIHAAAGPQLLSACRKIGRCPPGHAVITEGFALPSKYVIHAVGPVWHGGHKNEETVIAETYRASFAIARAQGDVRSIAFPGISTGAYKFPKRLAATIALQIMRDQDAHFDRIIACVFDQEAEALYRELM